MQQDMRATSSVVSVVTLGPPLSPAPARRWMSEAGYTVTYTDGHTARVSHDPMSMAFREVMAWVDGGGQPALFDMTPFAYRDERRAAYPPMGDQLDALWKGGTALDEMKARVMTVKARFPKPS